MEAQMSLSHDPATTAAQYRVVQVGDVFELHGGSGKLTLTRGGAFVDISATPTVARWHANNSDEPFHVVSLAVTEFSIGFPGDEGWSSNLVDDCIFVIDGEALRHVPLTELRVLSEERFNTMKTRLAADRGEAAPVGTPKTDQSLAVGTIAHVPPLPELGDAECLDCSLGIPRSHLDKLVQGCLARQISSVRFRGIIGGLSSSFEYGALRDLVVISGGELSLTLNALSFEYRPVELSDPLKSEPPPAAQMRVPEEPRGPSDAERTLAALEKVTAAVGSLRTTVIGAAWALAVALVLSILIR